MRHSFLATAVAVAVVIAPQAVRAETIFGAMAKAYENNSSLNSARAGMRVTDESVALAKSGYRPRVTGTAGITNSWSSGSKGVTSSSFGITISQSLFDGFQTRNGVRAAELNVLAQRENLRNTEQNVLFDTAQAYMDVLQNQDIDAMFAIGDGDTNATVSGIAQAGKAGQVHVCGMNFNDSILNNIQQGTQDCAIDQQGYQQGFFAVSILNNFVNYGVTIPTREILTGPGVIDASNVDQVIEGVKAGAR